MPIEDIRAIIIAAHQISFSHDVITRLLAQDSVVLHCGRDYKPVGWSVPLSRVVHKSVFESQLSLPEEFKHDLWRYILQHKMEHQAWLLDYCHMLHPLHNLIAKPLANEANVARQFWQHYFLVFGYEGPREKKGAQSSINSALNYGYAVISTLIHRSILVHGLLPQAGIHHQPRAGNTALIYDLVEPLRGFVELLFIKFAEDEGELNDFEEFLFEDWIRFLMTGLRTCRLKKTNNSASYKLMDAIDKYVASFCKVLETKDLDLLWIPKLEEHYWHRHTKELQTTSVK